VSRWMKPWAGFVASLGSWGCSSLNMSLSDSSRLTRADSAGSPWHRRDRGSPLRRRDRPHKAMVCPTNMRQHE
jgi:hypothetical protein